MVTLSLTKLNNNTNKTQKAAISAKTEYLKCLLCKAALNASSPDITKTLKGKSHSCQVLVFIQINSYFCSYFKMAI